MHRALIIVLVILSIELLWVLLYAVVWRWLICRNAIRFGDWVRELRAKRAAPPRPHVPEDKQP